MKRMTNRVFGLFLILIFSLLVYSEERFCKSGENSALINTGDSEEVFKTTTEFSVKVLIIIPAKHGANLNFYMDDIVGFGWEPTLAGLTDTVAPCPWSAQLGNLPIVVDTLIAEIQDVSHWDVLVIMPANATTGNAYGDLLASTETLTLVGSAVENGLIVWATCAGVRVLAAADVINGLNVTGNANYQAEYIAAGANFLGAGIPPVIDGNIITSTRGMYFHYHNIEAISTVLESQISQNVRVIEWEKRGAALQKVSEVKSLSWSKTYGDSMSDGAATIVPIEGGGFFVAGYTFGQTAGMSDIRALWLNMEGEPMQDVVIGGTGSEYAFEACQDQNNNLVIAGYTTTGGNGMKDFLVVNIQQSGTINWQKCYGGSKNDVARSICLTNDGNLLVCGYTQSFGTGEDDVFLIKTNLSGNLIWQKTFGGVSSETGHKVLQLSDDNYLILGSTGSFGAGNRDIYAIKTDTNGNLIWEHTYGTSGYQCAEDVIETNANELLFLGSSDIHGVDFLEIYVVKTDFDGNEIFSKFYYCPTDYYDYGKSVCETNDGNFIICSMIKYPESRQNDIYLFIINPIGEILWNETYGGVGYEVGWKIVQTNDGGFVFAGQSDSWGNGSFDTWVGKINNPFTSNKELSDDADLIGFSCSPNPFVGSINIGFNLKKKAALSIVNMQGKTVWTVPHLGTGLQEIIWSGQTHDGSKLPAGNYLVIITANGQNLIQSRITLLK